VVWEPRRDPGDPGRRRAATSGWRAGPSRAGRRVPQWPRTPNTRRSR